MIEHKSSHYDEMVDWYIENTEVINELERSVQRYNVSFTQYCILLTLTERDCSSPSDLADKMKMPKASISRTLKTLSIKKLIKKNHSDFGDQRKVDLSITDMGMDVVNSINELFNSKEEN